ncbi:TFIIB-type zinc ribbon-containing protein [Vulcanisaeta distributa]|nr:TFIIB-type zinc ribbon-containing protein [Vulcanisaeta distributa]
MVTANNLIKAEKLVCPNCGSTDIVFDRKGGANWFVGIVA